MARTIEEIKDRAWTRENRKAKPTPKNYHTTASFFKRYKELYWDDRFNRVKPIVFRRFLEDTHKELRDVIAKEAFEFVMPSQTGKISITLRKPPAIKKHEPSGLLNRKIDMHSTLELWGRDAKAFENKTKVYFTNSHSNGKLCKITYTTFQYAYFSGKRFFYFKPARNFKQLVSHVMQNQSEYPDAVYYETEKFTS